PASVRPLHLLVAEDNSVNQRLMVALLSSLGHSVELAADGAEALAVLARGPFDAVLMDVQMPVLDGLEATRRLRTREAGTGRRTPVFALPAHAMKGDRERCLAAGMDAYLPKPLDAQALTRVLAALTGNREQGTGNRERQEPDGVDRSEAPSSPPSPV